MVWKELIVYCHSRGKKKDKGSKDGKRPISHEVKPKLETECTTIEEQTKDVVMQESEQLLLQR